MKTQVQHRLRSEAGASLSIALVLMLVCVVISATVIGAATVMTGRLIGLGVSDKRYFAVTSAEKLFDASLDENNHASYTSTQSWEESVDADGEAKHIFDVTLERDDPTNKGYDFLEPVTCYALYGVPTVEAAKGKPDDVSNPLIFGHWLEGIDSLSAKELSFTVTPSGADDQNVKVNCRIKADSENPGSNYILEMAFVSQTGGTDEYSIYIKLQGEVQMRERVGENDKQRFMDTQIDWQVLSISPGRGL